MRFRSTFHLVTLFVALATLGIGSFLQMQGCTPPVSDEATVTVSGRVLYQDGTPASDLFVRLKKTDLNILDVDWVVGSIVNTDATPFLDARTDAEGNYEFTFSGAEANSANQLWAAYFVVYVIHPDDDSEQLAVASDSFSFSNQETHFEVPDMRFWDLSDTAVSVTDDAVTVTLEPSQLPPEGGTYIVYFPGTEWTAEVQGTTFSLPLTALEPCTASVANDVSECSTRTQHSVQVVSLADGLRYRSRRLVFAATNPKGMGLWYRQEGDNSSGQTCSGMSLFDINDGKFSGENAVQVQDNGMKKEDFRCLVLDLGSQVKLGTAYVHNAAVWFHKDARIEFSTSTDEDSETASWTSWNVWEGKSQRFWNVNLELDGAGREARLIRIEFTDIAEKAFWQRIGEFVVYPLE